MAKKIDEAVCLGMNKIKDAYRKICGKSRQAIGQATRNALDAYGAEMRERIERGEITTEEYVAAVKGIEGCLNNGEIGGLRISLR